MKLSRQRAELCAALAAAPASAPTLCAGWTAHHLAAHVWLRENDLVAAAGLLLPPLAEQADARVDRLVRQRPYRQLVDALRGGPGRLSPFRLPGVEAAANTVEFFVHTEDVRRGGGVITPRRLDEEFEQFAWRRLGVLGPMLARKVPVALWLEGEECPEPLRLGKGASMVTLAGRPSELLLYLFGRREAADVTVHGEAAAVAALSRAGLGV